MGNNTSRREWGLELLSLEIINKCTSGNPESITKMADVDQQENGDLDLWSSILRDVQSSAARKLRAHKSILLLGNDESGKSTLISKIRGKEDEISRGHGLEYTYLDVHDEELDDYTRLNVWILDGDPRNKTLLKYALTPKNVNDILVVLVVDCSKPWFIMDSLHSWTEILREHIHSLKLTPKQLNEMEERIVQQFQEYVDPDEVGEENKRRSGAGLKDEDKVLLPLEENVLADNLGLPMVVVLSKTDSMSMLEKDRDYREEHFDFIQQHIRRYCLKYGAALFYTSVKEDKNCNLFWKYVQHRIYGLPFNSSALVVDKDSIFIPSGWDSMKKISIINEHLKVIQPEDSFVDHITKPIQRKPLQEKEIAAEEEQAFLAKQQQLLQKNPPSVSSIGRQQPDITKPRTPGSPSTRMTDRRQSGGVSTPAAGRAKVDNIKGPTAAGAATSEGVLANFFNSLLNKKTGAGAGSPPGKGSPSVRSDAAAELDRMTRTKKLVGQQGRNEESSSEA